ncbi:histone deacetylase [Nocardia blacklockiae]|uniref:histone deacetylase n=1 Tax=Nocardia blacklockiae TaxID=480036 RepID=UPI001893E97A|nr:histone deacetylase [Nocardia blacklockiae]MBF6172862.1 histone deacetylase [Nocardia blacklockiae]
MCSTGWVWYAAYGSNLFARRLDYYRRGGNPPGTPRTYPGFRDPAPPRASRPLRLPGTIYFAWESPVWTGGVAFYAEHPEADWPVGAAARGYLLTFEQFEDLLAQEMYRVPGSGPGLDLAEVTRDGTTRLGAGRYETLLHVMDLDGFPVLTFTSPWQPETVRLNKPSPRYLAMLTAGLRESHGWTTPEILAYLTDLPGIRGRWHPTELRDLVAV